MIRTFAINERNEFQKDLHPKKIFKFIKNKKNKLWIDIQDPTQLELGILSEIFDFHPLSIEDVSKEIELPKIDDFGDYIFVVLHRINFDIENAKMDTEEIDFFLGRNYIVSIHKNESKSVDITIEKITKNPLFLKSGCDFIMHGIIDKIVDHYFPLLDHLEDTVDIVEEKIVAGKTENMLKEILHLKKDLSLLRKSIGPQRDVIHKLTRGDYKGISSRALIYYRDIYDHIIRIYSSIEVINEMLSTAFNAYTSIESNKLNVTSNKMNYVMQKLALVSTIFLPLTFIASFYGMNFKDMIPNLDWHYSFFIITGFMLLLSFFIYFIFKRKQLL